MLVWKTYEISQNMLYTELSRKFLSMRLTHRKSNHK